MITLDHVSKQYKTSARPALDDVSVKIDKGEFVFLIGPSGSGKSTFMRLLLAEDHPTSGDIQVSKFHVSKQYKSSARPALDNVSVRIDKGEFVFLIGPSGSGKSTFMRLLLAEESPTQGDVRVSKFHVNKLPGRHIPSLRQVIGCVFQDFRLLQQKTVFENVAFALEVIGKRPDTINRVVPDVLEMVGLSGKASRLPGELSGGEQQRVAIARAFVNRPLVLLADEPTGNLDPDTSKDIMNLLEQINRTGTTVVMATHDHHIVDSMRQRVVELSLGRLVRDEQRGVYGMDR